MKVTVCIGSSCHLKGSRQIIENLQNLLLANNLNGRVDLGGTFCTGNCAKGVCVIVDGKLCSVLPETTEDFFKSEVLSQF